MAPIIGLAGLEILYSALFWLAAGPEQRAVEYLAREVPRWAHENHCYSCHNNGDAARALFIARRSGRAVPSSALADTVEWLRRPASWDETRGNPGLTNTTLARIQFASALVEAGLPDRGPLAEAARTVAAAQDADGSWRVDAGGLAGAPATYGKALASYMARRVLDAAQLRDASAKATAWLREARPENVVDAAAILRALPERRDCARFLRRTQSSDGGWGEVFDTAVAVLALQATGDMEGAARGRAFLVRMQQPAGGWPETTRPPGGVSYAEHISTTAWALEALLATGR